MALRSRKNVERQTRASERDYQASRGPSSGTDLHANAPLLQGLAQEELDLAIHAAQLRACKPCNGVVERGVEPQGE
jgi:hypothetical protein